VIRFPSDLSAFLKPSAVSPGERQQNQGPSRRLCLADQPLPTFCLLSESDIETFLWIAVRDLKMNNTTAGCMGDSIGTPDRIEFVDQCSDVELGRVDRYAKTASYCFIRQALSKES
jgi:hypothetical protein